MAAGNGKRAEELALQVMRLSRDDLLIHLRFFDLALANLKLEQRDMPEEAGMRKAPFMMTNGAALYYDPEGVLRAYMADPRLVSRTLLL